MARLHWAAALTGLLAAAGGCSHSPGRIETPEWDPAGFSSAALAAWDVDGDQALDAGELSQAPGLAAGAKAIDQDGDRKLTAAELAGRFQKFQQSKIGLASRQLVVTYRGRPVAHAEVRLEPEPFLAGVIEPARGTTDAAGHVNPDAGVAGLPGLRCGYYRVHVAAANLPEKFNGAAAAGAEVSTFPGEPASYGAIEVRLVD